MHAPRWTTAVLAAAALAATLGAPAGATPPQRPAGRQAPEPLGRADYRIEVRLEERAEDDKRLVGRQFVTWTNQTAVATDELWFHLYWNAFSNTASTHLREADGKLRGVLIEDGWGWQRVTSIRSGGADLMPSFRYRAPDDGNPGDKTVFTVVPSAAVGPGESIQLEIEWEARIPKVRRRTGYKGDFLFIAHWFPKLGVFEGERGWNCHQFHANTEFYSLYGAYDVTIDLPARYENKVGATGVMVSPMERTGERVITRFLAPSLADRERIDSTGRKALVHDFTWTADPDYKVRRPTFYFERWKAQYEDEVALVQRALGKGRDLSLRNVAVTVMVQPEHEGQWERHFDAACAALFFYGLWFGGYPYEHLTVVDPAWGASAAGGMEYPMLFTCGTRLFAPRASHTPESVTVHEAGHQFFYGLLGNNEFEAAWLDEGFNSYADSETLWRRYGPKLDTTEYSGVPLLGVLPAPRPGGSGLADVLSARRIPLPWLSFDWTPLDFDKGSGLFDAWRDQPYLTLVQQPTDPRWHDRTRYLADPDRDPIATPGWEYVDRTSYVTNSYPRTAVVLRSLPAVVGHDRFLQGMRHYAETWRYRHPYPDDFFRSFQEGAGVDVSWYFDELFRGTATVDWSVQVEQRRALPLKGYVQPEPGAEFVPVEQDEPQPAAPEDLVVAGDGVPSPPAAVAPEGEEREWEADVVVVRRGELRLPLPIELRFDDGTVERRLWSREEQEGRRWMRIEHRGSAKLTAVLLDPDRSYYLDANMADNRWFDERDRVAPWRWAERVFNRYLHLMHWQAGIGG